jgi:hypothetical protein
MYRSSAPVRLHTCCQGTSEAWCSIAVTTTESSGPSVRSPHPCATRFIDSVVFFVKMTSSRPAAPMNEATASCAASYASEASIES